MQKHIVFHERRKCVSQHISATIMNGNQLNALTRLKSFLGLKERLVLVNSFIYSNFDHCPLVWRFSHKKLLNKTETLHKRALRFLLNYYENSYEQLLEKSGKSNMNLQQIRFLGIER